MIFKEQFELSVSNCLKSSDRRVQWCLCWQEKFLPSISGPVIFTLRHL